MDANCYRDTLTLRGQTYSPGSRDSQITECISPLIDNNIYIRMQISARFLHRQQIRREPKQK